MARALGVLLLILGPAAAMYVAGYPAQAHYVAIGTVLAAQMCVLARPVAPFAFLLPVAYAAAAVTAQSTGGVGALIVAVAAIVGIASSQGLQRGLLAVLAATLIGSNEPATLSSVLVPALAMLAGATYGYFIGNGRLDGVIDDARAVQPQTALSYAVLLAVLVCAAWFAADAFALEHGWWVPMAVAATGHPAITVSVRRSLAILAATLFGTLLLVSVTEFTDSSVVRAAMLVALGLCFLTAGRTRRWLRALLFTPILVLLAAHPARHLAPIENLRAAALACCVVFGVAMLGQWLLWTIRPDRGHAPA
jgi:hypothetical protein